MIGRTYDEEVRALEDSPCRMDVCVHRNLGGRETEAVGHSLYPYIGHGHHGEGSDSPNHGLYPSVGTGSDGHVPDVQTCQGKRASFGWHLRDLCRRPSHPSSLPSHLCVVWCPAGVRHQQIHHACDGGVPAPAHGHLFRLDPCGGRSRNLGGGSGCGGDGGLPYPRVCGRFQSLYPSRRGPCGFDGEES